MRAITSSHRLLQAPALNWLAAIILLVHGSLLAGEPWPDSPRIGKLPLAARWVGVDLRVGVVASNWSTVAYLDEAPGLTATTQGGSITWRAELAPVSSGGSCNITQSFRRLGDDLVIDLTIANLGTQNLAGVYLMVNVDAAEYAGGSFRLDETSGDLPLVPAVEPHLRIREATQCTFWNPSQTQGVSLGTASVIRMLVQDGRRWGPQFSILASLHEGVLAGAQTIQHRLVLSAIGNLRKEKPGALIIDPGKRLGRFEGFGGNFCFGLDNGVAEAVRARLRPPVARIRMHLDDLQPPPPGSSDAHADWMRMLLAADRPWTELWQCLMTADALHHGQSRIHISTWRVPAWLLDKPIQHDQNQIPPRRHAAFAGMVAAYLDYLRTSRGIEPETFSINEPDWGANVIFTSEEYRDVLLAVVAALRRHGLRTKLMIGDLSTARDATGYLAPALADDTLMQEAAAISFHAWGGASVTEYAVWRSLADTLHLPLVVGEIGADPNWREVQLHGYDYALRELALYLEVLKLARPQQVLYWEYGSSYALLRAQDDNKRLMATERFALQRHWVQLTPLGAEAIGCSSPSPTILAVAYALPEDSGGGVTLHIGNFGPATTLEIAGLPGTLTKLRAITTRQGACYVRGATVQITSGTGAVALPAESLTTLTTLSLTP